MDPWTFYQVKQFELKHRAERERLLLRAAQIQPARAGRTARAMLSFGRTLETIGRRLQARYRLVTADDGKPLPLSVAAVGGPRRGEQVP
jgi:hypothetical protein